MGTKWIENGPKNRPKMDTKLYPKLDPKMSEKLTKNGPKMEIGGRDLHFHVGGSASSQDPAFHFFCFLQVKNEFIFDFGSQNQ